MDRPTSLCLQPTRLLHVALSGRMVQATPCRPNAPLQGNALRHVLMRQKDVEFCGYSVPHPSEPFVHVRLQTTGAPARAVLDDGLKQLGGICDALAAQLDKAEGLAETRKRSDSQGTAFPGPGRALENARRLADRME